METAQPIVCFIDLDLMILWLALCTASTCDNFDWPAAGLKLASISCYSVGMVPKPRARHRWSDRRHPGGLRPNPMNGQAPRSIS